ncbi:MAG TPA: tetratricopeptide repeat protein [Kofleriaceae bacterium]|jgi:tetratricopeptide (TPR) repeat protein
MRLLALVFLGLFLTARPALADDAATRIAKRHFERGQKLYNLTRFEEALDEYEKAYDAKPLPAFLYNIAQCYRNLGKIDEAIFSYKKYLSSAPSADNREQVEQQIDELEQKKAEGDTRRLGLMPKPPPQPEQPEAQPPPPPPHHESHAIYTRWWFYAGLAVVAGGAGFGIYEGTKGGATAPTTGLGNISFP